MKRCKHRHTKAEHPGCFRSDNSVDLRHFFPGVTLESSETLVLEQELNLETGEWSGDLIRQRRRAEFEA